MWLDRCVSVGEAVMIGWMVGVGWTLKPGGLVCVRV